MISLTESWVRDGSPERKLIESIPDIRPLIPHIKLAHGAILAAQPAFDMARMSELQREAAEVDVDHDELVRGLIGTLTAFVYLTKDPARRAALIKLRDTLFPLGITLITKSYREEGGQAELLKARFTPEMKSMLKVLRGPDGTLLQSVEQYFEKANRLREIEDLKAGPNETSGPAPADMIMARNRWIRAINAVIATLVLAEVDEETQAKLLGPLRAAERAADQRGSSGVAPDENEEDAIEEAPAPVVQIAPAAPAAPPA
jgi:predicted aconitase with swiveling domain